MAEDFRYSNSFDSIRKMNAIRELISECRRQEETCLYTSTTLYIWLREARRWRAVFIVTPIVLGAIASWSIIQHPEVPWMMWLSASAGLLAGLAPAIRDSLALDLHVDEIARHAAQFKALQDQFRLTANLGPEKSSESLEGEVRRLLDQLDDVRKFSITPPERCFSKAREKIKAGHYDFSTDDGSTD